MIVVVGYFVLLTVFFGVQLYFWWLWKKTDREGDKPSTIDYPTVSILIPVRNEASNISSCLRSVSDQTYPSNLIQIVVINDHSTDGTVDQIRSFPDVDVVHLSKGEAGKKKAIQKGVDKATGAILIAIDGDCEVRKDWLMTMVMSLGIDEADLVTGPVWVVPESSTFIQKYQEMEQASLNVLTYAGLVTGLVVSANGANMAYRKSQYTNQTPYRDNQHIASGDDVFLIQKLYKSGGKVGFVRDQEAIVYTNPVLTWDQFVHQRLRWAGKSSKYSHGFTQAYLILFGAVNLSFVLLLVAGIWMPVTFSWVLLGMVIKFVVDYLIIHEGMQWGQRSVCWQDVLKASLFQVFYVNYVALLLLTGTKGRWKDR